MVGVDVVVVEEVVVIGMVLRGVPPVELAVVGESASMVTVSAVGIATPATVRSFNAFPSHHLDT